MTKEFRSPKSEVQIFSKPRSLRAAGFGLVSSFAILVSGFLIFAPSPCFPASPWSLALPGWQYEFPRDHQPHRDFKTEWWYFTGNLHDTDGRRFGYQVTFFRQGIRPPADRGETASDLIVNDLPFAHFCISDPEGHRFLFQQKISRGAFEQAGFGQSNRLAWIDDWSLHLHADQSFKLQASSDAAALVLDLANTKPSWTIHGIDGVSQKAIGEGRASHYYSGTRLRTGGTLTLENKHFAVTGESWFDHEWATNQLTPEQAGWDWFSVQLDDGSELMLYQMRLRSGATDPASSGTYINASGQTRHLVRDDYHLEPLQFWTSKKSGARYPVSWRISVPNIDLQLELTTPIPNQELALESITYWEGMIDLHGTNEGHPTRGHGYLELTGYASPLTATLAEHK